MEQIVVIVVLLVKRKNVNEDIGKYLKQKQKIDLFHH